MGESIVETTDSGDSGMDPVAMTIINRWKEYRPSWVSNQRPPVLKFATLLTELWGSAMGESSTIVSAYTLYMHLQ